MIRTTSFDNVNDGSSTLQCDHVKITGNNALNLFAHKINVSKAYGRTNSFQTSLCESQLSLFVNHYCVLPCVVQFLADPPKG